MIVTKRVLSENDLTVTKAGLFKKTLLYLPKTKATFIPSNLTDFFVFVGECALAMAGLSKKKFIYLSEDSKPNTVLKIERPKPAVLAGLYN
jgi:hypothetical protein